MEQTTNEVLNEQPNSVEISVNAKNQYSGKVKVYGKTIEEAFEQSIIYSEKLSLLIKTKNEEK